MKTGFWDRVLIYLYTFITLIIVVAIGLRAFGLDLIGMMIEGLRANAPSIIWRIILLGVCALVAVLGVYVAVVITPSRKKKGNFIDIETDDGGQVRISLPAIRQLASQAISGVDGLQDVKINIGEDNDAIVVSVTMDVVGGVHVPTVTANMKKAIKHNIEHNCGIAVRGVTVIVRDVIATEAPAVVTAMPVEQVAEPVEAPVVEAAESEPETMLSEESEPEEVVYEEEYEEEPIVLTLDAPQTEDEEPAEEA